MFIILAMILGALIAIMIQLNGSVVQIIGYAQNIFLLNLFALSYGTIALKSIGKDNKAFNLKQNLFFVIPGFLGICIVFFNNFIFSKGGVLVTLCGTLSGQTLAAYIHDFRRIPPQKRGILAVSVGLVLSGAFILGYSTGVPLYILFLSWVPGVFLMLQASCNVKLKGSMGTLRTAIVNFALPVGLLCPLVLSKVGTEQSFIHHPTTILIMGIAGLIGLSSVSGSTFILSKISATKFVLSIYSGQILCGLILDMINHNAFMVEKAIALGILAIGLIINQIASSKK